MIPVLASNHTSLLAVRVVSKVLMVSSLILLHRSKHPSANMNISFSRLPHEFTNSSFVGASWPLQVVSWSLIFSDPSHCGTIEFTTCNLTSLNFCVFIALTKISKLCSTVTPSYVPFMPRYLVAAAVWILLAARVPVLCSGLHAIIDLCRWAYFVSPHILSLTPLTYPAILPVAFCASLGFCILGKNHEVPIYLAFVFCLCFHLGFCYLFSICVHIGVV